MKLNDAVEHLIKQASYQATPEFRARARECMLAALEQPRPTKPRPLWRTIMTSKTTYCVTAIAAAIVLAVIILPLGGPFGNHGVVWAEVVKKTEAFDTLTHREKRVFYKLGQEKPLLEATVFKQISRQLGLVEKQYDASGTLTHVAYVLKKEKRFVMLLIREKRYLEWPLTDESMALFEDLAPQGMVKWMTRHGYIKLAPKELDGRKVEGFQMTQKQVKDVLDLYNFKAFSFAFPAKNMIVRLWVDVESSLPISAEADFTTGRGLLTGGMTLRCHFEADDLRWGAKINPNDFVPNIPDDYKRIDLTSLKEQFGGGGKKNEKVSGSPKKTPAADAPTNHAE